MEFTVPGKAVVNLRHARAQSADIQRGIRGKLALFEKSQQHREHLLRFPQGEDGNQHRAAGRNGLGQLTPQTEFPRLPAKK